MVKMIKIIVIIVAAIFSWLILNSFSSNKSDSSSKTSVIKELAKPGKISSKISFESFDGNMEIKRELEFENFPDIIPHISNCSYQEEFPACDFLPNFSYTDINSIEWQVRNAKCDEKLSSRSKKIWEIHSNGTVCAFDQRGNDILDSFSIAITFQQ